MPDAQRTAEYPEGNRVVTEQLARLFPPDSPTAQEETGFVETELTDWNVKTYRYPNGVIVCRTICYYGETRFEESWLYSPCEENSILIYSDQRTPDNHRVIINEPYILGETAYTGDTQYPRDLPFGTTTISITHANQREEFHIYSKGPDESLKHSHTVMICPPPESNPEMPLCVYDRPIGKDKETAVWRQRFREDEQGPVPIYKSEELEI